MRLTGDDSDLDVSASLGAETLATHCTRPRYGQGCPLLSPS